MKLFKTLEWPILEIGALKWSTASIGLMIGAFFPDFIKQYLMVFVVIACVTTTRVFYFYYIKNK